MRWDNNIKAYRRPGAQPMNLEALYEHDLELTARAMKRHNIEQQHRRADRVILAIGILAAIVIYLTR